MSVGAGRPLYNASLSGSIPAAICNTSLAHLDLHGNRFDSAPAMARCTNLATLDLSKNSLAALPATLPRGLTHLYANANPLALAIAAACALTGRSRSLVHGGATADRVAWRPTAGRHAANPVCHEA